MAIRAALPQSRRLAAPPLDTAIRQLIDGGDERRRARDAGREKNPHLVLGCSNKANAALHPV
jgi:hypothetical protein